MRLGVLEFGRELFATEDLDPVYTMLYHSDLTLPQKERWSVAYWMFYSAGVCSHLSEKQGSLFWKEVRRVFPTAPRGTERRHFRTSGAKDSVNWMSKQFPAPESLIEHLCPRSGKETFFTVSARVQKIPQFGPWISFKVCDMMDRVLGRQIDSTDCHTLFFGEPQKGAELAAQALGLKSPLDAILHVQKALSGLAAPPDHKRKPNLQEVETVMCKWKAHLNGHYEIGKDTQEIAHALKSYSCTTSNKLLKSLQENTRCRMRATLC